MPVEVVQVSDRKVFEDYPTASCNECEHYWNDACDSIAVGKTKECKFYKATRAVVIPAQLEQLQKEIKNIRLVMSAGFGLIAGLFTIVMRMM